MDNNKVRGFEDYDHDADVKAHEVRLASDPIYCREFAAKMVAEWATRVSEIADALKNTQPVMSDDPVFGDNNAFPPMSPAEAVKSLDSIAMIYRGALAKCL